MHTLTLMPEQKALEINLDDSVYGAFAEIGAGQEVARWFFQVGAAAGTIAKTMSAYDKTVSDIIYGGEEHGKGRYVCENRLYKMLDHEYSLMEERLRTSRQSQKFFAFADTVAAINFQKTIKGDGWLGLRFQLHPNQAPNDLVIHVKLLDNDNRQQQQAVGILGVNMLYACFRYHETPEKMLISLMDNLHGRVSIDMARLEGPGFKDLDNRLVCLWLVKNRLSDVAIFGADKRPVHAGEFLYKKPLLIARGSYRPPTLVQQDMIVQAGDQFRSDAGTAEIALLTEITLENLKGNSDRIDEADFLDRVDLLCALGQTVIISNWRQHKDQIAYFSEYRVPRIGLVLGVRKLQAVLRETVEQNPDNILGAFGALFMRNVRFYVYPARDPGNPALFTAKNIDIPQEIRFLYNHLLDNGNIVDLVNFNPDILHISHKTVLEMIQQNRPGWAEMTPPEVAKLIVEKHLFEPFSTKNS